MKRFWQSLIAVLTPSISARSASYRSAQHQLYQIDGGVGRRLLYLSGLLRGAGLMLLKPRLGNSTSRSLSHLGMLFSMLTIYDGNHIGLLTKKPRRKEIQPLCAPEKAFGQALS